MWPLTNIRQLWNVNVLLNYWNINLNTQWVFKENLHQRGSADKEVCESLPYLDSSKTYTAALFFNPQEVYASHEFLELVTYLSQCRSIGFRAVSEPLMALYSSHCIQNEMCFLWFERHEKNSSYQVCSVISHWNLCTVWMCLSCFVLGQWRMKGLNCFLSH